MKTLSPAKQTPASTKPVVLPTLMVVAEILVPVVVLLCVWVISMSLLVDTMVHVSPDLVDLMLLNLMMPLP